MLNYANSFTTSEIRTETTEVSTMRYFLWRIATECLAMIKHVVNMKIDLDWTEQVMKSQMLADNLRNLSFYCRRSLSRIVILAMK